MIRFITGRPWGQILLATLLAVAVTGQLACDSGSAPRSGTSANVDREAPGGRFVFLRTPRHILRLDSLNGRVWLVPISGDGGWVRLGSTPDPAGRLNYDQRYGLFMLDKGKSGIVTLLRIDKATGRAWVGKSSDGEEWIPIDEIEDPPLEGDEGGAVEPGVAPSASRGVPTPSSVSTTPQSGTESELQLLPAERFGSTVEEQTANINVVMEALYKEGLPIEIKVWGAKQLALLLPEVAVPRLLDVLNHESPEVVVAAIASLQAMGEPTTIPRIIALQNHPDARVREAAQAVIVQIR